MPADILRLTARRVKWVVWLPHFSDLVKPRLLLLLVMAAIAYGSLYPFEFHITDSGQAGLAHLLGTWRDPPQSGGDLIANILLYMPLGFAAGSGSTGNVRAMVLKAAGVGAALSFLVEWLQFYDQSRVSCLSDFYLNVMGSLAGLLVSRVHTVLPPMIAMPEGGSATFARMLLFSWLAWRLFPYVPVIDLHKYWNSLKPVVLHPELAPYDLFRFVVLWMGVSQLLRLGITQKAPPYLLAAVMTGYFCAKVLIINQSLSLSEIAGAAGALAFSNLRRAPYYSMGSAILFAVVVVLSRILPWHAAAEFRPFQWVPFYSLLHGSLAVDIQSFCEKLFLYGTLLLLMVEAGLPLIFSCLTECITLLVTSVLETRIAGRSAEVTDALITLLLALVYFVLTRRRGQGNLV